MTRREALQMFGCAGLALPMAAAADFWNRKPVSAWSEQEITQLNTRSPWAKTVNADFQQDTQYSVTGADAPTIGRGGQIGAPAHGGGKPGEFDIGPGDAGGAMRREQVMVRWESAQPVLDASGKPLPGAFVNRYVLSVSGLPLGVMEKRRGPRSQASASVEDSPQSLMIEQLMASATLEARGKGPEQPGVVQPARGLPATYLFGFSKESLQLDGDDREVLFTLRTGYLQLRAKFEPKEMRYRGAVAL